MTQLLLGIQFVRILLNGAAVACGALIAAGSFDTQLMGTITAIVGASSLALRAIEPQLRALSRGELVIGGGEGEA